jgi:hypothetical protein
MLHRAEGEDFAAAFRGRLGPKTHCNFKETGSGIWKHSLGDHRVSKEKDQ